MGMQQIAMPSKSTVSRWAAALTLACVAGCSSFRSQPTADYRTVQASPTRDTEQAIAEHNKALKILDRCTACYQCECVKNALCDPCKAEQHLQNALIADVRYGPAHNTLGTVYFSQRKLYLAAWEFEYASGLMPERPEPLNNLGLVYEKAGKLGLAISAYEEAVELSPNAGEYVGNLARAHLRQGTPFEEVRYLLEHLVAYDARPTWVCWAEEQLGTNPLPSPGLQNASFDTFPVETDDTAEIIDTPQPDGVQPDAFPELVNPLDP